MIIGADTSYHPGEHIGLSSQLLPPGSLTYNLSAGWLIAQPLH